MCGEDEDIASDFLILKDNDEVDIFVTPARAAQPAAFAASPTNKSVTPAPPVSALVMLDMCKRAAAWLDPPP